MVSCANITNVYPQDGSVNNVLNVPIQFDVYIENVSYTNISLRVVRGLTEEQVILDGVVTDGYSVQFDDVHDGTTQGVRVIYSPTEHSYGSTVVWEVTVSPVNFGDDEIVCTYLHSIAPFSIGEAEYRITYDSGLNIEVDRLGDWMYFGSAASKLLYDSNLDMPERPIRYGEGYVYGTSFQANAILDELVIFNSMHLNSSRDNLLGRSPFAYFNRAIESTPNRETLLLAHLNGCIYNEADYFATKNNLFLVDGKYNEGVVIDSSPIIIQNINKFDPNEGTIELWVKRNCINSLADHYLFDVEPFQTLFSLSGNIVLSGNVISLIDANGSFLDLNIKPGDVVKINSGKNIGVYPVKEVGSQTQLILDAMSSIFLNDRNFNYSIIRKQSVTRRFSIKINDQNYASFTVLNVTQIADDNLPVARSASRTYVHNASCNSPCCVTDTQDETVSVTDTTPAISDADKNRTDKYEVSTYIGDWLESEWHHVAVTYRFDSSSATNNFMKLFIDGIEMGCVKVNSGAKYSNGNLDAFIDKVLRNVTVDGNGYAPTGIADIDTKLEEYYDDVVSPLTSMSFSEWKESFNSNNINYYGHEPYSGSLKRGVSNVDLSFDAINYANIYIGSDMNSENIALATLDDFRISKNAKLDNEVRITATSLTAAPEEVGITRIKLDFDANMEKTTQFTFLRNDKNRYFEFEVEVLNDFGFPIDKTLITQLIQIVKPAHTTARVRFA